MRSFTRRSAPRRKREWARTGDIHTLTTGAATATTELLANFESVGGDRHGATVTNIKIAARAQFESTTVTDGSLAHLYWGIIMGDYTSAAEVPLPVEAGGEPRHADWMHWQHWQPDSVDDATASLASSNVVNTSTQYGPTGIIEVRSRRRIDELNDNLWLVSQWQNADANLTIVFTFTTSVLLLLP